MGKMRGPSRGRGWALALLLGAAVMVPAVQAKTDAVQVDPADWPRYARDLGGTRFSPLNEINAGNVENLDTAWSFRLRPEGGAGLLGGTVPIVIDGTKEYDSPFRYDNAGLPCASGYPVSASSSR